MDRRSRLAADGDFQTRIERLRETLVAGISSHELSAPSSASCSSATVLRPRTRARSSSGTKGAASVVQVLRETLADHAGQARSFNSDLLRSTDRIGTLADVDDIRELKRLISEARELTHAVVEKQRRDDVLFTQMSKRVDALQTQLAEAQKQAELDPLTEVANRRGFDRAIKEWSLLAASRSSRFRSRWSTSTASSGSAALPPATRSPAVPGPRLVEDAEDGPVRRPRRRQEFAVLFGPTMDSAVERATSRASPGSTTRSRSTARSSAWASRAAPGSPSSTPARASTTRSSAPSRISTRPSAPARTAR